MNVRTLIISAAAGTLAVGGLTVGTSLAGAYESGGAPASADATATVAPAATDLAPTGGNGTGIGELNATADTDTDSDGAVEGRPGRGRHGCGDLDAAAEAIGIDVDELRDALDDGSTLAEVADANGVDRQTLVDALVARVAEHVADEVTDGELTQAEADERIADATARIEERVDTPGNEHPARAERPARPAEDTAS